MSRAVVLVTIFALAACGSAPARESTVDDPALDLAATVPNDPRLVEGVLGNGVRYEILPVKGALRTQLWLVVGAGSLAEDDDQRGLAHLVEHLAFEGTARFPGHAIRDFVEHNGMVFGPDVNAETGYDATTYKLAVPSDAGGALDTGLDVLRDWAADVSFEPAAIDHERTVVEQERPMRLPDPYFGGDLERYLLRGTRFADRRPIGDSATVLHARREALVRFYRDWYRPDLMTVIVVGDVDPARVGDGLRARFGGLRGPDHPRPRPHAEVHVRDGDAVLDRSTHDMGHAVIEEEAPNPHRTFGDLRRQLVDRLHLKALDHAPLGRDGWTEHATYGDTDFWIERSELDDAAAVRRFSRAARSGLPAEAVALARRELLEEVDGVVGIEPDTSAYATDLADRAIRGGGWFVDAQASSRYAHALLEQIGDDEIARRPRAPTALYDHPPPYTNDPREIAAQDQAIRDAFAQALRGGPDRPSRSVSAADGSVDIAPPLPTAAVAPGRVVATRAFPNGVLEWTLSNGARVAFKQLAIRGHGVRLFGFSPGGASLAPARQAVAALLAPRFVDTGPARTTLARAASALGVTQIGVDMTAGYTQIVAAASSADHVEAMLGAVDAEMTARDLGDDPGGTRDELAVDAPDRRSLNPMQALERELWDDLDGHDPYISQPSSDSIAKLDPSQAVAFYRARFGNAGNFTFVIVGDVDADTLRPVVERTLAGLPSTGTRETPRAIGFAWRPGDATIVRTGVETDHAEVRVVGWSAYPYVPDDVVAMQVLDQVIVLRVRGLLRDALAEVYASDVDMTAQPPPGHGISIEVSFACAAPNATGLAKGVRRLLRELRDGAITDDDVARAAAQLRRAYEVEVHDAEYWKRALQLRYQLDSDAAGVIADPTHVLDGITPDRIRALARRALDLGGTETGILRPHAK